MIDYAVGIFIHASQTQSNEHGAGRNIRTNKALWHKKCFDELR